MSPDTCPSCGREIPEGVLHGHASAPASAINVAPPRRCVYACGQADADCMMCGAPICWDHGARHTLPMCDAADVCMYYVKAARAEAEAETGEKF